MPNPKGGIDAQAVNPQEAYNRIQYRAQDRAKDAVNPQVGNLEDRARAASRKTRTGSKDKP